MSGRDLPDQVESGQVGHIEPCPVLSGSIQSDPAKSRLIGLIPSDPVTSHHVSPLSSGHVPLVLSGRVARRYA